MPCSQLRRLGRKRRVWVDNDGLQLVEPVRSIFVVARRVEDAEADRQPARVTKDDGRVLRNRKRRVDGSGERLAGDVDIPARPRNERDIGGAVANLIFGRRAPGKGVASREEQRVAILERLLHHGTADDVGK
jgi:hypothetical protein